MRKKLSGFQLLVAALLLITVAVIFITQSQTRHLSSTPAEGPAAPVNDQESLQQESDSQIAAEADGDPLVLGESTRKAAIFLDKNKNGIFDSGESACDVCVAKALLLGEVSGGIYPAASDMKTLTVGSLGVVPEAELAEVNTAWGFYPDRSLAVLPFTVTANDGSADIHIPARETEITVSGENANLLSITKDSDSLTFVFSALIPSLQSAANNSEQVWVQLVPNPAQPDYYYLGSGVMKRTGNTDAAWSLKADFNTGINAEPAVSQLHFFLL